MPEPRTRLLRLITGARSEERMGEVLELISKHEPATERKDLKRYAEDRLKLIKEGSLPVPNRFVWEPGDIEIIKAKDL